MDFEEEEEEGLLGIAEPGESPLSLFDHSYRLLFLITVEIYESQEALMQRMAAHVSHLTPLSPTLSSCTHLHTKGI